MLYELRFSINDICNHTFDFSCIDEDLIEELKTIKPQLNYSSKSSQLENKFHMINDTLIPNGFFLKVYVIKKKITILNLADQQNYEKNRVNLVCFKTMVCTLHVL